MSSNKKIADLIHQMYKKCYGNQPFAIESIKKHTNNNILINHTDTSIINLPRTVQSDAELIISSRYYTQLTHKPDPEEVRQLIEDFTGWHAETWSTAQKNAQRAKFAPARLSRHWGGFDRDVIITRVSRVSGYQRARIW